MTQINKKPIILIPRTENKENRTRSYNTKQWRDLRNLYFQQHPICEICEQEGKIVQAEDIHHKKSPFEFGLDEATKQYRLLDWNNLQALCKEHHAKIHNQQQEEQREKKKNKIIITKRK